MTTYKDYQPNTHDDFFTESNLWKEISPYIPKNKVISMPFYSPYSKCNELLGKYVDNKIIYQEEDFFDNDRGDIVVDNPPFSIKKSILLELYNRKKPFMLILPIASICYKYFRVFKEEDIQILIPEERPKYTYCNPKTGLIRHSNKAPPFDTCVFCWKIGLPKSVNFL